jgi:hypothetical protein
MRTNAVPKVRGRYQKAIAERKEVLSCQEEIERVPSGWDRGADEQTVTAAELECEAIRILLAGADSV